MARQPRISTRLSAANLVHLGAPRLADLLIEAGAGNANLKRRLRLELAAEAGPDLLALEMTSASPPSPSPAPVCPGASAAN